jgi:hypothetical protein
MGSREAAGESLHLGALKLPAQKTSFLHQAELKALEILISLSPCKEGEEVVRCLRQAMPA